MFYPYFYHDVPEGNPWYALATLAVVGIALFALAILL